MLQGVGEFQNGNSREYARATVSAEFAAMDRIEEALDSRPCRSRDSSGCSHRPLSFPEF
jgi:hypothetical protein